jgi:hypothetical protein
MEDGWTNGVERHFLCLLKRPFLVPQLMLRPTLDTHLCDDVRAPFAAPDLATIGAFARRAPARVLALRHQHDQIQGTICVIAYLGFVAANSLLRRTVS